MLYRNVKFAFLVPPQMAFTYERPESNRIDSIYTFISSAAGGKGKMEFKRHLTFFSSELLLISSCMRGRFMSSDTFSHFRLWSSKYWFHMVEHVLRLSQIKGLCTFMLPWVINKIKSRRFFINIVCAGGGRQKGGSEHTARYTFFATRKSFSKRP